LNELERLLVNWWTRFKDELAGLKAIETFLANTTSGSGSAAVKVASPDPRTTATSSVIKTVSLSAARAPKASVKQPKTTHPAARHSHVSASVIMALFVGGSGALSVLPELPNAQRWFIPHAPQRIALLPPRDGHQRPALVEASVGGSGPSLLLDALKPNVADDLTQAQAMPETRTVTIRPGDTLSELLTEAGASAEDAHEAVTALRAHFDPRRIKSGQDIELTLGAPAETEDSNGADAEDRGRRLLGFAVQTDLTTHVQVSRDDDDGFNAEVTEAKLTERAVRAVATIDSSLFIAAEDAGIPDTTIVDMIRLYSYDIDFQREIQKGDSFELYYTQMVNEKGQVVQNGRILYAGLTTGGKTHKLWRYTAKNDSADYYDETGRTAKKFLMRTPVDGARLTSGYGMRMHPLLGYTKMHKGVDFGAPVGTPVMAAGAGTVEYAAPYSTYGNYVRIRHTNGYKTAYAHLKGFARGIKVGAHVTQGQLIAYVGMTGRSTGPHLHYEVLVQDHQVNPMGIKVATGEQLEGTDLMKFRAAREEIATEMANAAQVGHTTTASISTTGDSIKR
jgi:murein DD-endopeptidase MepM/ murein hydrolase activator NlpD